LKTSINDFDIFDPEIAAHEIQRATARLNEITSLVPSALSADIEASLEIAAKLVLRGGKKSLRGFKRQEVHLAIKEFFSSKP
jgi:hypothetical protein